MSVYQNPPLRDRKNFARRKPAPIPPVDFAAVNAAALVVLVGILKRWLSDGRLQGREWVARNPVRADRCAGSFKVNVTTGQWADFASGDKGGDPISLIAYLEGITQVEAARALADMLGVR